MTNKNHLETIIWAATVLPAGFMLLVSCGNDKPTVTPEDPPFDASVQKERSP